MNDWKPVITALIGSWPSHVGTWGREVIAAYCAELEAREVSPQMALTAIRACPAGQKFPPSAPELAGVARSDPDRPTFEEAMVQLYGPGGVYGFKRAGVVISPWVLRFAEDNRAWLRGLPVDDPDEGKWARLRIREAWTAFLEASEGRRVAEIARRSAGELKRVDPLAALGAGRREIEAGR